MSPRPGKRRRLTVVDLRDSDAMFVALMRLLVTLTQRHPEYKTSLDVSERLLDGAQDDIRKRIEQAETAPEPAGEELPL